MKQQTSHQRFMGRQETPRRSVALPLLLAAVLALMGQSTASAQTITSFDVTGATGGTFPAAINLSGTVAGEFDDAGGQHGFLRAPSGAITTFDPTFCTTGSTDVISSSAINTSGAAIGSCGVPNVGFLRDPLGNFTEINPPGSTGTQVNSINNSGQVAGSYVDSSKPAETHGFVWDPVGGYTSFDVPGGTYAEDHSGVDVVSINNSGQVAGFYYVSSSVADGFLRNPDNTFTTFPAPVAGDRVQATSMNDSAQITGFYGPGFTTFDGFLQQGAATTSFDVVGVTQTEPESINSSGTIVGSGSTAFNNAVGFVRNPLGAITTFVVPSASNTQPQSVNNLGTIAGIWLDSSFKRHGFIATVSGAFGTPSIVSESPNPASGSATFALEYSDTFGYASLNVVAVIFNTTPASTNSCYVYYAPATNRLYLQNDSGQGATFLTPGSGTLANSQCTINGSGTSVMTSGNDLTLNLDVAPSASFEGPKSIYMYAQDNSSANTGWINEGAWTPSASFTPSIISVTRQPATNSTESFALVYSDTGGNAALISVAALFNTTLSSANACYVYYVPESNLLYLQNNNGQEATSITPGSGMLTNNQCTINGTSTSVVKSGNTLTLNLSVTGTFTGTDQIFMKAADNSSATTGWVDEGTWTP